MAITLCAVKVLLYETNSLKNFFQTMIWLPSLNWSHFLWNDSFKLTKMNSNFLRPVQTTSSQFSVLKVILWNVVQLLNCNRQSYLYGYKRICILYVFIYIYIYICLYRYVLFALVSATSYLRIFTYSFGSYRGLIRLHFVFWSPLSLHSYKY